jgi:Eco29kI restriction endonuclease
LRLDILSRNLQEALKDRPRTEFPPSERFAGAGLYALYYKGPLELYAGLREKDIPIYVGKAEAGNSSYGDPPNQQRPNLSNRIGMHARSIREVTNRGGNLAVDDFEVRYLVLDDVWIVLGERALLRAHAPVLWNTFMSGFGANPPGSRRDNARSVWDTIHPGRPRAGNICNSSFTRAEMTTRIRYGITASLMPEGAERYPDLQAVRAPGRQIWGTPKKNSGDDRILVFRVPEFLSENAAIGSQIEPDKWRSAEGHESEAEPVPEADGELNTSGGEQTEDE